MTTTFQELMDKMDDVDNAISSVLMERADLEVLLNKQTFMAGVGAAVGLELFFRWVDGESWDDVASVQSEAWYGRINYRSFILMQAALKEHLLSNPGHYAHHDPTGGGGAGCPACLQIGKASTAAHKVLREVHYHGKD